MQPTKEVLIPAARYIADLLLALNLDAPKPNKPEGVSYRAVYVLARRHSLASTIWYILEDEIRASGEEELVARFERECEIELAKHVVQSREFRVVSEEFEAEGVDFLPLKGFIIKELWRRPEYRTMTDMDIYVSEAGLSRAASVLKTLGYKLDHASNMHDSYMKPPYVNIELHKMPGYYSEAGFSDWSLKEGTEHWYVMSPEETFFFLVGHMYKHYNCGGIGIRAVFDLYLYLLKNGDKLDHEYINGKIEEYGMSEFYAQINRLMAIWFGGEREGSDAMSDFEYFIIIGGTFGTVENRVSNAFGNTKKSKYLITRIFPSFSSMVNIYRWLRYLPFLLPVAWIIRLVKAMFDGRMAREMRAWKKASGRVSKK